VSERKPGSRLRMSPRQDRADITKVSEDVGQAERAGAPTKALLAALTEPPEPPLRGDAPSR
jgi:hypothetical protein